MTDRELQAWARQEEERQRHEDGIIGSVSLVRQLRQEQILRAAEREKQRVEEEKAKAEKVQAEAVAALDARHKAHELSMWRFGGRGSDSEFEKQWPQRRAELQRAEVDKTVSATNYSLYKEF